ncbi:hypothetical protein ACFSRY_18770 [Pontibacter locisalis]|uniref:STAS/SEC14 domain-containing protein n=1 Tax=Pontibacter locisalis TaxID=1719035 RepID=A0ABW5ISD2_9BACT
MSSAEYLSVLAQLAVGLLPASVEKIARVATGDTAREERLDAIYKHIRTAVALPLELRTFPTREEALRWLTA